MKVLIACEFSCRVREEFKKKGHDAWSCDYLDPWIPGKHIKGNVLDIVSNNWDLMIAFPPCTYLSGSQMRWYYHPEDKELPFHLRRPHPLYLNRRKDQEQAIEFFMKLIN